MSTAVFARLFLYFIFYLFCLMLLFYFIFFIFCCSLPQQRGSGVSGDAVLVPLRAASHPNDGFLSVRLRSSKLSFSSFSQVFTAADRQIRPRQWKRVTNLLLITVRVDTFVLINPDKIECCTQQRVTCCGTMGLSAGKDKRKPHLRGRA